MSKVKIYKMRIPGCPVPVYISEGKKASVHLSKSKYKRLWWPDNIFAQIMKAISEEDEKYRQYRWRQAWEHRAKQLDIQELLWRIRR